MLARLALIAAAALLLAAPPARADGAPSTASPTAAPATATAAVVKIDIAETIDGADSAENLAAFFIRKKLREAGLVAWSAKHIHADDVQKTPPDAHPEPDLTIKGTVTVKAGKKSTFYGKEIAFGFVGAGDLKVLDKAGKQLAAVQFGDEWGEQVEKDARLTTLKRISWFSATKVVTCDPIRAKMSSDKTRESSAEWAKSMEKKLDDAAQGDGK